MSECGVATYADASVDAATEMHCVVVDVAERDVVKVPGYRGQPSIITCIGCSRNHRLNLRNRAAGSSLASQNGLKVRFHM